VNAATSCSRMVLPGIGRLHASVPGEVDEKPATSANEAAQTRGSMAPGKRIHSGDDDMRLTSRALRPPPPKLDRGAARDVEPMLKRGPLLNIFRTLLIHPRRPGPSWFGAAMS